MSKVLWIIMLTASLYIEVKGQTIEGVFSSMEAAVSGDTARFSFSSGDSETAIYLINGVDSLKTRISGDFIRNKYVLKEENGVKKLYLFLRPKWNYDNVKGMGFGKAYLSNQRIQQRRQCL